MMPDERVLIEQPNRWVWFIEEDGALSETHLAWFEKEWPAT